MEDETVRPSDDFAPIEKLVFWSSRFGDVNEERLAHHADAPALATIEDLVELLYPETGDGVELAFVASADGVLGIVLEWEFGPGYVPDAAVRAHWRVMAPPGCRFSSHAGSDDLPTFEDAWVFVAFVPAEGATRELVERCGDLLVEWGCRG